MKDPLILRFLMRPARAKVVADNAARIKSTKELPSIRNRDGQETPRFFYRASHCKQTGKLKINAPPAGYTNNFIAFGSYAVQ